MSSMDGKETFRKYFHFFLENKKKNLFPTSILLSGATGVGKTFLIKQKCFDEGVHLEEVSSLEEEEVFLSFKNAEKYSTSVLLFDSIDLLVESSTENVCPLLCHLIKKIKESRTPILVVAITNRISFLKETFKRKIFEQEIVIGVLNIYERKEIFRLFVKEEKVLKEISKKTEGFLACDIKNLCWTARMLSKKEELEVSILERSIPLIELSLGKKNKVNFEKKYYWEDIGGLDLIIEKIRRYIEIPLLYPEEVKKIGSKMPRGVLLYGPPGSSKTTIAKTIATNCSARFFSIDSAELYSCYVGESERILREAFLDARISSPSILFIDEIDSIVGKRNKEKENSVRERILSTLLNEMDGIEEIGRVVVLSATNRIDLIDPALLRPGRFDKIIEVGYPSNKDRRLIFETCLRKINHSSIDTKKLSDITEGFSGADIKNICQEAGFISLRKSKNILLQCDIEEAIFKVKSFD